MAKLRLMPAGATTGELGGEVGACAYTPDSAFVLSSGFDGQLHLWEASQGSHVTGFPASPKPVPACTVSPDGQNLVSGALDGIVTLWNAVSHEKQLSFMASPRPIAALVYSGDGKYLASASWDGSLSVWQDLATRQVWTLQGHRDIVAGCCFTPDARQVLSWSYDSTVRLWDLPHGASAFELHGHSDRVTAGAISTDGQWAATGSRDGTLILWDLRAGQQVSLAALPSEARGCMFLADETLLAVDRTGLLSIHQVPALHELAQLSTRVVVECCALAPNCQQLVLGCNDGRLRFVAIDGMAGVPLTVNVTQINRKTATAWQRLFGSSTTTHSFRCICPGCRQSFMLADGRAGALSACPKCKQKVRVGGVSKVVRE